MRIQAHERPENSADPIETHIAGIVVHVSATKINSVREAISILPGAEIHAVSSAGKIVVTLEAAHSAVIVDQLGAIHALPGVYSAALVYQHHEDAESMDQEIGDEPDASCVH
jgi:nitrate reductase NapD